MSQTIQTSDLDTFWVKTIDQAVGIFSFISDYELIHFFVLSVLLNREENVSKLLSNDAERDAGKENQS